MDNFLPKRRNAAKLVAFMEQHGPVWKTGSDVYHLNKRKRRGHVPADFTLEDLNKLIQAICTSLENETFVYFKEGFEHDYFVFGDSVYWIAIVGENGIMETVFPPDSYKGYLDLEAGYHYIGTIKEVLQHG